MCSKKVKVKLSQTYKRLKREGSCVRLFYILKVHQSFGNLLWGLISGSSDPVLVSLMHDGRTGQKALRNESQVDVLIWLTGLMNVLYTN